jgi:UDP-N-acetyl-D-mannosaminuronic acid dehydrogenase
LPFETVCVLGLGYIGLPTASTFATHGLKVIGVDVNRQIVNTLREGGVHIQEPGLPDLVEQAFESGMLQIRETLLDADAFIIAVPTPVSVDKQADLRHVIEAAKAIAPVLRAGNLVVLESTCPPGTTLEVVAPILNQSGLQAGTDFHLAYMPERVLPGNILTELIENARVIGGVEADSAEAAHDLYLTFVQGEMYLTDATTAEMVKLMENTYRDVNIAVANEFSRIATHLGVNIWEATELANRHPRVDILRPGPGAGGHCVAVDPWFLVQSAPEQAPLIKQAREVNDGQPEYAVDLIERAAGKLQGSRIAALGLAYKPDVDDLRNSPAIEIVGKLVGAGAAVKTFEPLATKASVEGAEAVNSLEEALQDAEVIVLLVDHRQFAELKPSLIADAMKGTTAVDLRGAWKHEEWEASGFSLHLLGVG